jgi:mRNA interferase MazF
MQRGEIYFVDLDPVIGREQYGRRPVVVVSVEEINRAPLVVVVVPGTDAAKAVKAYPSNVRVPAAECGLPGDTVFLCFQIRALDKRRFPARPAGQLDAVWMKRIGDAIRHTLGV